MSKSTSYGAHIAVMSAGFFLVFSAFNTASNLESTVVSDTQLVNASLATLYAMFTLMTIVAPKLVSLLGPRLAMTIGAIPYAVMVFANIAPSWGLFIPAFGAVGVGAAILWTAQGIYLSRSAIAQSQATGENVETVTSRFNGLFWTSFQFNGACGLIISSIIFQTVPNASEAAKWMFTGFGVLCSVGVCILFFSPAIGTVPALEHTGGDLNDSLTENESETTALAATSVSVDAGSTKPAAADASVSFYETIKLACSSRAMQLLIPIIFYNGASLGFFSTSFPLIYQDSATAGDKLLPKAFVGYVAASFYLTNSLFSFMWGQIIPKIGKRPLFVVTFVTHAVFFALAIALTRSFIGLKHESPEAYVTVFAMAILFALGDSVLESQVPSIVQSPTFFPLERDRDAAVSNVRTWQSLGFTAQFIVGLTQPGNNFLQGLLLAPLMVLSLLCLYALDRFVRPIEGGAAGKGA